MLPVLIKRHIFIYLCSESYTTNYNKMRRTFYLLYKTDKCEEFLQRRPSSLRSLLQFYKQIAPLTMLTRVLYTVTRLRYPRRRSVSQTQRSTFVTITNYPSTKTSFIDIYVALNGNISYLLDIGMFFIIIFSFSM